MTVNFSGIHNPVGFKVNTGKPNQFVHYIQAEFLDDATSKNFKMAKPLIEKFPPKENFAPNALSISMKNSDWGQDPNIVVNGKKVELSMKNLPVINKIVQFAASVVNTPNKSFDSSKEFNEAFSWHQAQNLNVPGDSLEKKMDFLKKEALGAKPMKNIADNIRYFLTMQHGFKSSEN